MYQELRSESSLRSPKLKLRVHHSGPAWRPVSKHNAKFHKHVVAWLCEAGLPARGAGGQGPAQAGGHHPQLSSWCAGLRWSPGLSLAGLKTDCGTFTSSLQDGGLLSLLSEQNP